MELNFTECEFLATYIDQQLKIKDAVLRSNPIDLVAIPEFLGVIDKDLSNEEIESKGEMIYEMLEDMYNGLEVIRERIKDELGI
jgi:hypothetical protein